VGELQTLALAVELMLESRDGFDFDDGEDPTALLARQRCVQAAEHAAASYVRIAERDRDRHPESSWPERALEGLRGLAQGAGARHAA
jgi:hypothetical protein